MKISASVGQGFYREYLRKRDNSKGKLSEVEFMSWLYTTQSICDAVHQELLTIDKWHISQYQLLLAFHDFLTPREIRIAKSVIYMNLKDNEYPVNAKMIEDFEYLPKSSDDTYAEKLEAWKEQCEDFKARNNLKEGKAKLTGEALELALPKKPKGEKVKILSPSEYKDVQDTMVRQVPNLNATFKPLDVSEEKMFVTFKSDASSYAIDGETLTNELEGFRPISLNERAESFINTIQFCGTAEENFINWFKHKLMNKQG